MVRITSRKTLKNLKKMIQKPPFLLLQSGGFFYNMGRKGFTLIELVLVVALLGVLSVGAIVVVYDAKEANLEVATQKVRSDIEFARSLAMTKKGTTFGVFFDVSENQYTVYEGTVATPVKNPQTLQNDLVEDFGAYSGVVLSSSDVILEFDEVGAPTSGGDEPITLTQGARSKIITVSSGTGHVTVQ